MQILARVDWRIHGPFEERATDLELTAIVADPRGCWYINTMRTFDETDRGRRYFYETMTFRYDLETHACDLQRIVYSHRHKDELQAEAHHITLLRLPRLPHNIDTRGVKKEAVT